MTPEGVERLTRGLRTGRARHDFCHCASLRQKALGAAATILTLSCSTTVGTRRERRAREHRTGGSMQTREGSTHGQKRRASESECCARKIQI